MSEQEIICQVDNIIIRRYRDSDAEPLAAYVSSPALWNQLSDRMPHPYTLEDARSWIAHTRSPEQQFVTGPDQSDQNAPRVPVSYVVVVDGNPCGSIALVPQTGIHRLNANLGYWLAEEYHGKGIMSKAATEFVKWTWNTFGYFIRLNGQAYETNIGSQKVMQRAGFVMESRRINACIKNGEIRNEVTLAALRPANI